MGWRDLSRDRAAGLYSATRRKGVIKRKREWEREREWERGKEGGGLGCPRNISEITAERNGAKRAPPRP
jgi:hypothetical protein